MAKSLNDTLQQQLDKNDPTQRAIGLLAALVDNKLEQMNATIEEISKKLETQEGEISNISHARGCPHGIEKRVASLETVVEPLSFVNNYPKLTALMFLGLVTLLSMGIDKIFDLIKP